MKQIFLFLTFISCCFFMQSQQSNNISVFFESGQKELSSAEKVRLRSWMDSLSNLETFVISKISLQGHCDNVGSSESNMILSSERVMSIKKMLETYSEGKDAAVDSYGESLPLYDNANKNKRPFNRRVDITVHLSKPDKKIVREEPLTKEKISNCDKDTILKFPQGTEITIKVCDFEKYLKDCPLKVTEYLTGESIRKAGLNTMTVDDEQLATGGMFKIEWCRDGDFPFPLQVSIPSPSCIDPGMNMNLWALDVRSGRWSDTGTVFDRVANGMKMTALILAPGSFNCDALIPTPPPGALFVSRNRYKILNLRIYYDCPDPGVYEADLKGKKSKRRVRMNSPCPLSEPFVYARAIDKNGDIHYMHYKPLNDLKKRKRGWKCGNSRGLDQDSKEYAEARKSLMAKKYLLRKDDFDLTVPVGTSEKEVAQMHNEK